MIIKPEGPTRLVVSLDGAELKEYGLTFSQLDYHGAKTKQLLNALLIKATRTTDFKLIPGKLIIEAFPADGGGCTICFTIKEHFRKIYRRAEAAAVLYSFQGLQDMLDALTLAYIGRKSHSESRLYKQGNAWLLAIWGAARDLKAMMNEFALSLPPKDIAPTAEHGRLICNDAIRTVGAAFYK